MRTHYKSFSAYLRRFWAAGIPALAAGMAALLLMLLASTTVPTASATIANQASVVIQFDASKQIIRPIKFDAPISGLRALELSGVEVITRSYNFGDAVCSIGGVGCPSENCFCSSNYWGYWYWDGADWQSYPVGADSSVITGTGAVEGWRWGQFGDTLVPVTATIQALDALTWLAPQQNSAGDFGSAGSTVEAALALAANDQRNARISAYLGAVGATYARGNAAAAGKLAVALAGVDGCMPAGALSPAGHYSPEAGSYSAQSGANAWAMLGASAISETIPAAAIAALTAQVQSGGGWEWAPGWGVDTNATALALQALVAAGEPLTSSAVIAGLTYLDSVQNEDGGFPYAAGEGAVSDVNSTAYVMQALLATGENPRASRWTMTGGNAFDYLAQMQLADGSFEWQAGTGSNQLATQQAIPALLGRANPAQKVALPACPAIYLPLVSRD